jgi:hypothetical protein
MVLDEVQVDSEDLGNLLPELERSFGVTLPLDLGHVHTVGDLFGEIVKHRRPSGEGDRCDTAMTFFLLRRSLVAQGLKVRAHPTLILRDQSLGSPRKVKQRLERETGLQLPPLVMATRGCVLMALFAVTGVAFGALEFWALAVLSTVGIAIVARTDRGQWSGEWETLGSLSRATAIRNVMRLGARGARSRRSDWWRSFLALFVASGCATHQRELVYADEIGATTRFRFT